MSLLSAHQALEEAIDAMLKALEPLDLDAADDADLDAITTALCARSSELEEWIKGYEEARK